MQNGAPTSLGYTMAQNVIIPRPGSSTEYFIVTPDVQAGTVVNSNYPTASGVNVAVVDMALAGGLGAVTSKFVPLKAPGNCEMLSAVRHANGIDYWLIGHEYGNDVFFVYSVTSNGIAPIPLTQTIGPTIDTPQPGAPGP